MKKLVLSIFVALTSVISTSAQSIELHQSYGSDSPNAPYLATRIIASYFWSNEKMNFFTWNSFDRGATNTLLYTEHQIGKSNFYIHPEVRFDYWYGPDNDNAYDTKPQIGLSYLIPGTGIYLTPKATITYDKITGWSNPDLQFSINSSYDNSKIYYEGYIDTEWFNGVGLFTEQKAYYKMTDKFQIGASVVVSVGKDIFFAQPYFSIKTNL